MNAQDDSFIYNVIFKYLMEKKKLINYSKSKI